MALFPQQNAYRNLCDLSGLWAFQLDPQEIGEKDGWCRGLPAPRSIAVPASWNEQFEDTRDYMGVAWYLQRITVPPAWRGQKIMLRFGSATYAAKVWIDGKPVGSHLGGHLPFEFDVSALVSWNAATTIAVQVENKPSPTRVPPAATNPELTANTFPDVTYDFFPYCGLDRPVLLYSLPPLHITDVTVVTSIDGGDGVIDVTVAASDQWSGRGALRVETGAEPLAADLMFKNGTAQASIRVRKARLWSPDDPFLHPLSISLKDGDSIHDAYTLDIGIRTVEVRGDRLLLNGQPIHLKGFGRHEDFPVHGRGLDLPVLVRDHALLKWVGANSYRTSHYPYSDEAMALADKEGFLIIDEIPAVGLLFDDGDKAVETRLATCRQQVAELIARDKNHPSVIMWSVANEPASRGALRGNTDSGLEFFTELLAHARAQDPTRPALLVGEQRTERSWVAQSDVITVNRYWGWYILPGQIDKAVAQLARELDELHAVTGKPVIIAEFGADAVCAGALLALAYPDRVARNRGAGGGFLLANGRGANVDPASALAREPFLAVAEIAGTAAQGRIAARGADHARGHRGDFADRIESREDIAFDAASASLRGRRSRRLGAIALSEQPIRRSCRTTRRRECWRREIARLGLEPAAVDEIAAAVARPGVPSCAGPRATNGPTCPMRRWPRRRRSGLRRRSPARPRSPTLGATNSPPRCTVCCPGTCGGGSTPKRRRISSRRPARRCRSTMRRRRGRRFRSGCRNCSASIAIPAIAGGRVPLVVELLSPAHRPVQVTRDLPGFWRGSYAAVKAEMKGRYPRHPWPDNPLAAAADAPRQAARRMIQIGMISVTRRSPRVSKRLGRRPRVSGFFGDGVM